MPLPADFLPAPPNAAALPPRACPGGSVRTEPKDLLQKDEMARRMMSQLRGWGKKHFRFDGPPGCTDFDFVISQWQALVGLPQTGVLGAGEVASMLEAVKKIQPQLLAAQAEWSRARGAAIKAGVDPDTGEAFTAQELERRRQRQEAQARARSGTGALSPAAIAAAGTEGLGPEPTVLDFLPTAPGPTERECSDGLAEAQRWAWHQAEIGRMSRGVAYGPGAEFARHVPEHWGRISQQYGEIGLWTQSRSPAGCPARAKLRAWLKAIGDASDIDDPRSTSATVRYVTELRGRLKDAQARYASERDAWLAAQRERAAALAADPAVQARVRTVDFASFPPGTKRTALSPALPPALCTGNGDRWSCSRATDGCRAERDEAASRRKAVQDAVGRASLMQLLTDRPSTPPGMAAELQQRLVTADLVLQKCEILHAATAAARSELRFGPSAIDDVALLFEGGELVEMSFAAAGDVDAIRNLITRRYGAPQVRAERRSYVTGQLVPGLTPDDDDDVIEHVTTIDVAHETWSAPGVVVRGSEGKFTMLRTAAPPR